MKENMSKIRLEKAAKCPDETTLSAYLNGALHEEEVRLVEEHISDCHFCLENIRAAYEGEKLYKEGDLPDSTKELINKAKGVAKLKTNTKRLKRNFWLFGTILAFALSFIFPKYFVQFLVAALILGLKWVFESENARTLIMVLDSWRRHSREKDEGISDKIKDRF